MPGPVGQVPPSMGGPNPRRHAKLPIGNSVGHALPRLDGILLPEWCPLHVTKHSPPSALALELAGGTTRF